MCLEVTNGAAKKKAETDIACWKWAYVLEDGGVVSPVMESAWEPGEDRESALDDPFEDGGASYTGQGLHAFLEKPDRYTYESHTCGPLTINKRHTPALFKAIVPRGAEYYEGVDKVKNLMAICASRMRLVERVGFEEDQLSYDEWYAANEERINIELAETGADREMDFDPEREFEKRYEEYCDRFINSIK